ncbi:MAG: cell surface protein SprA [Candidatus Marinimicrobia bacterium]|nr:cell surface protein SprA [Candidatus Neomarinimicrobiota bacterium]MCF7829091.1 cell surface protein SprA [Candidatus Neomarinimicrobiota bacterium]MCF7881510.1 cell surface protein SprA [Candidatus Neomarinimicrobiota bacterium]
MPAPPIKQPSLFEAPKRGLSLADRDSTLPPPVPFPLPLISGYRRVESTDSTGHQLIISQQYHGQDVTIPIRMSLDNYYELKREQNRRLLLREALTESLQPAGRAGGGSIELIGADIGGQRVSLRVSGNVNIEARALREDKNLTTTSIQAEPNTNILFNQRQNFNIEGNIGDRINVLVDYNSERDFQFENDVMINYTGSEDDIIQRIDAGNINLSLPGTQLVTFSPNSKGLFGIRTDMKLGPIDVVTVASIEQGKKQKVKYEGGESSQEVEIYDYNYIQDKYFFLGQEYRDRFYPLDNANLHSVLPTNLQIDEIDVYKSLVGTSLEDGNLITAKAWPEPDDKTYRSDEAQEAEFQLLTEGADYTVDRDLGYLRLSSNIQDTEILAVAFTTMNGDTVGQLDVNPNDSSAIALKMIRPQNPNFGDHGWNLMMKNVYSLGTVNLTEDGFEFQIVDTYTDRNDNLNEDGVDWLQVFGLDRFDQEGNPVPDDKIDITNIVDLQNGEIFFPYLEPFRAAKAAKAAGLDTMPGEYNPRLDTTLSQSEMYESRNSTTMSQQSSFKMVASYSNQSSNINLPGFNIIENSEEVRLNGNKLNKGTDYTIDYFMGQITLLEEDALKPGQDLEIMYETNEIFQLDKKVVIGGRAEYKFGDNSFLAATGMYYSKSSIDDKVRVGQEPFRNFVWDVNGRYRQDFGFVTKAVDFLPLVRTDAPSNFEVEGEYAQVIPNPNTQNSSLDNDGVAYIDDFEGSKKTTTMTVYRRNWTTASRPEGYNDSDRGFLFWYNPRGGIPTRNIWPEKETSVRTQNNTTDILNIVLDPRAAVGDRQPMPSDSVWAGLMRSLPSSYRDQTESKFIEIWARGDDGTINIDLGKVSEDVNGDGELNTEDIKRGGIRNGILDEDEDVGIDGLTDSSEVGVYAGDTLNIFSDPALFEKYGLLEGDPAGDNYNYSDQGEKRYDYRFINGTQENGEEQDGRLPDTEDINRNNILDREDRFFSYSIPLDTVNNPYYVSQTVFPNTDEFDSRVRGKPTGWKLYRVPLTDFVESRTHPGASMEEIEFTRMWFSDFEYEDGNQDTISIARMEIVGNEWIESQVRDVFADTTRGDSSFSVTVINNEENPEYSSPNGVRGAEDRVNNITSKEQSLVMKMANFDQWYQGVAVRDFKQNQELSLLDYKKIEMFIHGDNFVNSGDHHLQFFYRLGRSSRDNEHYYEYRTTLQPGWQSMELDLDFLTQLKTADSLTYENGAAFPPGEGRAFGQIFFEKNTIIFRDTSVANPYELVVYGEPSLGKINNMKMGARNFTGEDLRNLRNGRTTGSWPAYHGEIWLNELRVTGVRREGGTAMRMRASIDFADLMSVSFSTNRVDADFHKVDTQWGDNMNTESYDVNVNFNAHKFLPESWGVRIPLRGRYNESLQVPKYLPGSDLLTRRLSRTLTDAAVQDTMRKIESYSLQRSYGGRISRSGRSENWIPKFTINAVQLSYDFSESYSRGVTYRYVRQQTNTTQGSYNVQFPKGSGLELFKWMKPLPLYGDALSGKKFFYLPTKFDASASLREQWSDKATRVSGSNPPSSYNQTLQRSFGTGYSPFDNLSFTFSKTINSNASNYRGDRRWEMVKFLKPGQITGVNESYNSTFNPTLASWLRPSFRYQSSYQYNKRLSQDVDVAGVGYSQRASVNFSLDLQKIKESFSGGGSSRPGGRPGGRSGAGRPGSRPSPGEDDSEEGAEEEEESRSLGEMADVLLNKLQPINFTFNKGRTGRHNNLVDAPGIPYRLGFVVDPDVMVDSAFAGQSGNRNITVNQDLSLRSGINITRNISATLSFSQGQSKTFTPSQVTSNRQNDFVLLQFGKEEYQLGDDEITGLPFPGWSLRWSGLEDLAIFQGFAKSVSMDHSFTGRYETNYRNGEQRGASYTQNLQPLVGLRMTLEHDISMQTSFGLTKKVASDLTSELPSIDISNRQSFSFSTSYQRNQGMRLPLPYLRDLTLDNRINFSLTFDYSRSVSEKSIGGQEFQILGKDYSWQVQPKIDYSFTDKVSGGIYYKYGNRYNNRTNAKGKPTKFTDFGLTVNIQIRG